MASQGPHSWYMQANSASFVYKHNGLNYLMNLVDTPGHVDFSYEVSRALAACQGACLLVDAAQGIQVSCCSSTRLDTSPQDSMRSLSTCSVRQLVLGRRPAPTWSVAHNGKEGGGCGVVK